jgi:hypothetical protein
MNAPALHKQRLLARNAALRAELAGELAGVRAELAPALRWLEQAQRVAAWTRAHAPLLAALAVLVGMVLLRHRADTPPEARRSPLRRLWRMLRLAITIGGLAARFTRPGTPP